MATVYDIYAAIDESIIRDSIVTIRWSALAERTLEAECEGSAQDGQITEYWGIDVDDRTWRVHVRR